MNELAVATEIPVTELAALLGAPTSELALGPYLGMLTPHHFDSPEAETRAMLSGAAMHDLGWLRRIAVRGEDRFRWLSGMVTNDVEGLENGAGAYNLVLNAQGRIQGDCLVWRNGDRLELEWTAEQEAALLAHLDRFIIMDDVELVPLPGWTAIGLAGPQAHEVLTALGLPLPATEMAFAAGALDGFSVRVTRGIGPVVPHFTLWVEAARALTMWGRLTAARAVPVGCAALETIRDYRGSAGVWRGYDEPRPAAGNLADAGFEFSAKGATWARRLLSELRSRGQVHRSSKDSWSCFPKQGRPSRRLARRFGLPGRTTPNRLGR